MQLKMSKNILSLLANVFPLTYNNGDLIQHDLWFLYRSIFYMHDTVITFLSCITYILLSLLLCLL